MNSNDNKIFNLGTEIFGALQIIASQLLLGSAIAFILYLSTDGILGYILAAIIATLGLISGIILCVRTWKKHGTLNLMSRVSATPDLDKKSN